MHLRIQHLQLTSVSIISYASLCNSGLQRSQKKGIAWPVQVGRATRNFLWVKRNMLLPSRITHHQSAVENELFIRCSKLHNKSPPLTFTTFKKPLALISTLSCATTLEFQSEKKARDRACWKQLTTTHRQCLQIIILAPAPWWPILHSLGQAWTQDTRDCRTGHRPVFQNSADHNNLDTSESVAISKIR
jgi:hypothetical protein